MVALNAVTFCGILALARAYEDTCYDKFEYVFKVMERLSDLEKKLKIQEQKVLSLTTQLEEKTSGSNLIDDTYTRWGRSSCPKGSEIVYDGFAAGSHFESTGGAANYQCLIKQPRWSDTTELKSWTNNIYGAEYEIAGGLYEHDVPCAVCRVPRSNVIMLPGTNDCYQNYTLEYSGYLMSGHDIHQSATEFVCVDDKPEAAPQSNNQNENGRLFYFVSAKCGALKCPPYEEGKKITCAVCSM